MLDRRSWQIRDGRTRPRRTVSATIAAALVLALCGGAAAAAAGHVVPPNGKVGGKGYSYYLERGWKTFFASPGPCQAVTVGGLRVAVVSADAGPGCNEPAGRPVYVTGPDNECSTLPGDHNGYGKTPSQLEQCARAGLKVFSDVRAFVDGQPIPEFARFITATEVFAFRMPKNRFPGIKQRGGRSAAYGYGLLLTGLTKGTHKVRHTLTLKGKRYTVTTTLRVW
jgi:hypothetical protein